MRELRLTDVVQLALEKNLDISVERLNPQAVDLQIAGLKNTYLPIVTSSIGQRDNFQLPRDQLQGGNRVSIGTTTFNGGVTQIMPWYGGNLAVTFNNNKQDSSSQFVTFDPQFVSTLNGDVYATAAARLVHRPDAAADCRDANQPRDRRRDACAPRSRRRWPTSATRIGISSFRAAQSTSRNGARSWPTSWSKTTARASRSARWRRSTSCRPRPKRPTVVRRWRSPKRPCRRPSSPSSATSSAAPKIRCGVQELRPIDLPSLEPAPTDIEGAVRKALERRTDLINARKNLQSSDISLKYFRNQTLPDVDLVANYGAQGIGGTQISRSGLGGAITSTNPGGYSDALRLLFNRDYPTWNVQFNVSYNLFGSQADATFARARLQSNQSQARLRALELQVATEVTNAALTVQSNLKRVEAAVAARELAEKRLEAEQSKFEVGMTTNFFVVQAQRDLRDAQNSELRAHGRLPQVARHVRARPGSAGRRRWRRWQHRRRVTRRTVESWRDSTRFSRRIGRSSAVQRNLAAVRVIHRLCVKQFSSASSSSRQRRPRISVPQARAACRRGRSGASQRERGQGGAGAAVAAVAAAVAAIKAAAGGGFGGGGFRRWPGGGGGFRPPMTVEVAKVARGKIASYISVVGNLIGEATVEVAPKTGGRLAVIDVKLGDRVRRGQVIAKVEDREIVEQIRRGRGLAQRRPKPTSAAAKPI